MTDGCKEWSWNIYQISESKLCKMQKRLTQDLGGSLWNNKDTLLFSYLYAQFGHHFVDDTLRKADTKCGAVWANASKTSRYIVLHNN